MMEIRWDKFPKATHYLPSGDHFYFMKDGYWQLCLFGGDSCRSDSLYNGQYNASDLVAKTESNHHLIAEIQMHFKRIGELLDYLDVNLPVHEATLNKAKENV